ncbi:MAG TPA: cytochrome C [Anaerolineae bacterium]|nr:cytochrome C [Anaerolineae bacterium]HMR66525.1 cytochrome C [Anaerolineae bacterium]
MASDKFENIVGPRAPADELAAHRMRYWWPTLFLATAAILLVISIFLPYWSLILHAPQYPNGLVVHAYVNHLEGDVQEIDGLNHYIGMRPLNEAAQLERQISIFAIAAIALLVFATVFIHSPWSLLLALPAILLPPVFLADLYFWLNNFGQNLDPTAALSSSVEPFTPTILGEGMIGQFRTEAFADFGLLLASAASILILIGLYLQRRAYKPLVEAQTSSGSE